MQFALVRHIFVLEFKKIISFRAEFWIGFLGNTFSQFGVAFFLWKAVFAYRAISTLQGFTFPDLILYYLMVPLIERVVAGPEMGFISPEIYEGTLTRYLLYPISFFRFKYVSSLAQSAVFILQFLLAASVYLFCFGKPPSFHFEPLGVTLAVLAIGGAGYLYFMLASALEMLAFWADNVWSLLVLNRIILHLFGGGLIPLAFFPNWAQKVLSYLPFTYMVSFPIRFLRETLTWQETLFGFGVLIFWSGIFTAISLWLWRKGTRQYAGVGI